MGSYSVLSIEELQFDSSKNDVEPAIMMLFADSDKRVTPIPLAQWVEEGGDVDDWSEDLCQVKYICRASEMRDRLELRGYTREVADESFRIGARKRIKELRSQLEVSTDTLRKFPTVDPSPQYLRDRERQERTLEILATLSPQAWVNAVRCSRDRNDSRPLKLADVADLAPELQYITALRILRFGYPGADLRSMLRLALDAFPDDAPVTYDLTSLVMNGYFDSETDMIQYAEYVVSRDYDINRSIIVLTEGSTDRWILEKSLKLLRPHLAPFFTFMDFDVVRLEGGAGSLANMVKAFAAAGILNRIVAIFDNDTAGNAALRVLTDLPLPLNIKLLSLPPIDLAREYPTLGPSGVSIMDVNGLACGIELYLGWDCLAGVDGQLTPVQWKGYDAKLRRYQGELLAKREVLERFRVKLADCESNPSCRGQYDWSGVELIIDTLRSAFHEEDRKAHIEYEEWAAGDL